ncbi:MAG TPA: ABC transporter substrate-binding protein [Syntrophorhabdales bacterium]|nr:ABC transporter substrate-binding protein [Syntrophorhabdales bacterium]
MTLKTRIIMILIAPILVVSFQQGFCQDPGPTDTVRKMLDEVISIQTDKNTQGQEYREARRTAIKKVIVGNFNFEDMATQALGAYWGGLSSANRSEFKRLFQDLFLDSYSRLVLDFLKKEKVEYLTQDAQKDEAKVRTRIYRMNEAIPVDYSLLLANGTWLVRDVRIDGVSIVENYRKSFTRLIKQESFDALLKKMRLQQQAVEK